MFHGYLTSLKVLKIFLELLQQEIFWQLLSLLSLLKKDLMYDFNLVITKILIIGFGYIDKFKLPLLFLRLHYLKLIILLHSKSKTNHWSHLLFLILHVPQNILLVLLPFNYFLLNQDLQVCYRLFPLYTLAFIKYYFL